jgi:hypothetical protein
MSSGRNEAPNPPALSLDDALREAILRAAASVSVTGAPAHRMDKVREQLAEFRAHHSSGTGRDILDEEAQEVVASLTRILESRE